MDVYTVREEPDGAWLVFWPATDHDGNDAAILSESSDTASELVTLLEAIRDGRR